jgi:hypothetical protein
LEDVQVVPDGFDWPASWKPLPLPDGWLGLFGSAESAEIELAREVVPGHLLYGVTCRTIAFNAADPNEFLFVTGKPETPLAFVHLTWQAERDPIWPYTVGYPGWEAFRVAWRSTNQ